jgi:RNA polymerase sigma-70 factor (ECF subfamily)
MIRLQDGDAHAFAEIVAAWQGPLHRFFNRSTHDPALSEDLVQETLLRLYRTSWDYIPIGMFRGFLFRIARNLLIDQSRRRASDLLLRSLRRSQTGFDETDYIYSIPAPDRSAETTAQDRELNSLVRELLEELPEEQRITFVLYHYESLTLPEVADATASGLSTTKSRLRLAREKLRSQLAVRGFGGDWTSPDELELSPPSSLP